MGAPTNDASIPTDELPARRIVALDPQGVPGQHRPRFTTGPRLPGPTRPSQIMPTRVGLQLPDELPYDVWEAAGQKIFRIVDSSAWCLGDWLVYGQDKYDDRYRRAVEAAGLDY